MGHDIERSGSDKSAWVMVYEADKVPQLDWAAPEVTAKPQVSSTERPFTKEREATKFAKEREAKISDARPHCIRACSDTIVLSSPKLFGDNSSRT